MIDELQTLTDNGLSTEALKDILADLLENDDIDDIDEHRRLVALEWYLGSEGDCSPDDCTFDRNDTISIGGGVYRVLTDDEADEACADQISESVWAFNADFLAGQTGIDRAVFEALADKCEGAQDAIKSIIDGSCGIAEFVDSAVSADGRGSFLAGWDGDEIEGYNDWYLYRVN